MERKMKFFFFLLTAAAALFLAGCASERIYVGGSDGIALMKQMWEPQVWVGEKVSSAPGVSYMAYRGRSLYAARRVARGVFAVDVHRILKDGSLRKLDSFEIPGNTGYCHISLSADGKFLFGSAYSGSFVDVLSLAPGGGIIKLHQRHIFSGSSIHKRQKKSHLHFAAQAPDNSMVLAADLGSDRIHTFAYDSKKGLIRGKSFAVPSGAGPRHLSFSENGKLVFSVNELNNSVTSFKVVNGELRMVESFSLLPRAWSGTSSAGAIKTLPGNRLCVTNRGHNSLVILRYSDEGKLALEHTFSAEGDFPYDVSFADGRLFLVNMRSDSFSEWRPENKGWVRQKNSAVIRRPMCIVTVAKD